MPVSIEVGSLYFDREGRIYLLVQSKYEKDVRMTNSLMINLADSSSIYAYCEGFERYFTRIV